MTLTAMCCTASSSFLLKARMMVVMKETIKVMIAIIMENMLLS